MNIFTESTIVSVRRENDTVSSFMIKDPVPDSFCSRKAGQYLLLKLPKDNAWSAAHPFTITSRLDDDFIGITVKKVGAFTTALHAVTPPSPVLIRGPQGNFGESIEEKNTPVFLAGGIGITPFFSLLTYLGDKHSRARITLFWANNTLEDYFSLDFLEKLSAKLNLETILIVNNRLPDDIKDRYSFTFKEGFVTRETLKECVETDEPAFYMCGSENMQKYVLSQLSTLGIPPDMVETERIGTYMKNPGP